MMTVSIGKFLKYGSFSVIWQMTGHIFTLPTPLKLHLFVS